MISQNIRNSAPYRPISQALGEQGGGAATLEGTKIAQERRIMSTDLLEIGRFHELAK